MSENLVGSEDSLGIEDDCTSLGDEAMASRSQDDCMLLGDKIAEIPDAEEEVDASGETEDRPAWDKIEAREYQLEMLQAALEENTIIYMEPGAGKTYIAIMYLQVVMEKALSDAGGGSCHGVFLVNTVSLVLQQAQAIEANTPFKVNVFHGDSHVRHWNQSMWEEQLQKTSIWVMTAQVLLDLMRHAYIFMKDIHCIVFDECHHARKRHPYNLIMQEHYHDKQRDAGQAVCTSSSTSIAPTIPKPRILGLTASPVHQSFTANVNMELYAASFEALEANLDCKIKTPGEVHEDTLLKVIANPRLVLLEFEITSPDCFLKLIRRIFEKEREAFYIGLYTVYKCEGEREKGYIEHDTASFESEYKRISNTLQYLFSDYGLWAGFKWLERFILYFKRKQGKCDDTFNGKMERLASRKRSPTVVRTLRSIGLKCFRVCYLAFPQAFAAATHTSYETILKHPTDDLLSKKVLLLFKCLIKQNEHGAPKTIVFVERRIATFILHDLITSAVAHKKLPEDILSCPLVGGSVKEELYQLRSKADLLPCNNHRHNAILSEFRKGRVSMLITTDVAEEGIDIPSCSFVCSLDPPRTKASFIQAKGRARAAEGSYLLFLPSDPALSAFVAENCRDFTRFSEAQLASIANFQNDVRDLTRLSANHLKPGEAVDVRSPLQYTVESTGATVSGLSAVSLLHRYCSMLPGDQYHTCVRPFFQTSRRKGGFQVTLTLPFNSPYVHICEKRGFEHPLVSKWNVCRFDARREVCFDAVVALHTLGLLDDTLLPLPIKPLHHLCQKFKEKMDIAGSLEEYIPMQTIFEPRPPPPPSPTPSSSCGEEACYYYAYRISYHCMETHEEVPSSAVCNVLLLLRDALHESDTDFRRCDEESEESGGGGGGGGGRRVLSWNLPITTFPSLSWWNSIPCVKNGIDVEFAFEGRRKAFSEEEERKAQDIHALFCLAARFRYGDPHVHDYTATRRAHNHGESSFFALPCDREGSILWDVFVNDRWTLLPDQGIPDLTRSQFMNPGQQDEVVYGLAMYAHSTPKNIVIVDVLYLGTGNRFVRSHVKNEAGDILETHIEFVSNHGAECPLNPNLIKKLKCIPDLETIDFDREPILIVRAAPKTSCVTIGTWSKPRDAAEKKAPSLFPTFRQYLTRTPIPMVCFRASSVLPSILDKVEYRMRAMKMMRSLDVSSPTSRAIEMNDDTEPVKVLVRDPVALFQQALTVPAAVYSATTVIPHHVSYEDMMGSTRKRARHPQAVSRVHMNYEVLETLGDAVLKIAVTQILFASFPLQNEGQLSPLKAFLVSNIVLFERAVSRKMTDMISSEAFNPRTWYPQDHPSFLKGNRVLSNKTVADVVEALIGAVYLSYGFTCVVRFLDNFLQLFDALKVVEPSITHLRLHPQSAAEKAPGHYAYRINELQRIIGHTFRDQRLACEALTHVSYTEFSFCNNPHNRIGCYQRLEFLGDAVVDLVVTHILYKHAVKSGKVLLLLRRRLLLLRGRPLTLNP
jgi:ERCC4-related helicase/dsRNA-specific ribonuclease